MDRYRDLFSMSWLTLTIPKFILSLINSEKFRRLLCKITKFSWIQSRIENSSYFLVSQTLIDYRLNHIYFYLSLYFFKIILIFIIEIFCSWCKASQSFKLWISKVAKQIWLYLWIKFKIVDNGISNVKSVQHNRNVRNRNVDFTFNVS